LKPIFLFFLSFCLVNALANGQEDVQIMLKQLGDKSDQQVISSARVDSVFKTLDSTAAYTTFYQLKNAAGNNAYTKVRLMMLECQLLLQQKRSWNWSMTALVDSLFSQALKTSMELRDDLLIAEVCRKYSNICDFFVYIDKAVFFSLKSLDLQEKYGADKFPDPIGFYYNNADILYKAGEYELCYRQLIRAVKLLKTQTPHFPAYYIYNTTGLAAYKLNHFDSAIYWYRMALPFTVQQKDTVWQGIATGNIGAALFKEKKYDSAKYYLLKEYEIVRSSSVEKKSAYNSLLTVARILALQHKPDSALLLLKMVEPVAFNSAGTDNRNLYLCKSDVYKALGKTDSAELYTSLFQHQEDSIKEKQLYSKVDVARIRLNYENSQNLILQMLQERKHEKQLQLFIWTGIAIALVIAFMIYRQRLTQSKLEKKLLIQQKLIVEQTYLSAQEQLTQFTGHIIEKNQLIESLQRQLQQQNQHMHEELLAQTILTDEDWARFKLLFEKVYPAFFNNLQTNAPRITPAELRLAALIFLKLETKNMAAMLGVSVDSVRKSKSRLRQRLNIDVKDDLEEYIQSIHVQP
jgi:hypothetical protein